jgi:hypothetical protein
MNAKILGLAALSVAAAAPADAASFDAYTSFNGVNGNGGFIYGYTAGTTTGTTFDTSATGAACPLNQGNGICLYGSALGNIPVAQKGGSFPTVADAGARLVLHPGDADDQSVFAGLIASTAGTYSYNISLESIGRDTRTGVGYTFFLFNGTPNAGTSGVLQTFGSATTLAGKVSLNAGDIFGVIVDRNGDYAGDSTALSFQAAVPEPATWGMMLVGFGMVGAGLRRRTVRTIAA